MKVVVHGPDLLNNSDGSYRVHATRASENKEEKDKNGSKDPKTIDVASREDVVDYLYDPEAYDREPDDLPTYLSDIHFGSSLDDLPEHTPTKEDDVAYTPEQLKEALDAYAKNPSMRAVGRELKCSAAKATKMVKEAQAQAAAAKAQAKANGGTRRQRADAVPAKVDPDAKATCRKCGEEKPTTLEFWYANGTTGLLYTNGLCRVCELDYRRKRREAKAAKASAADDAVPGTVRDDGPPLGEVSAKETPDTDPERHLTAVA